MHHDSSSDSFLDSSSDANLDRRSLLGMLSASPFVFGLSAIATGQDKQREPRPSWFEDARRQAKKRGVKLVGFVTPDLEATEQPSAVLKKQKSEFKSRLQALYNGAPSPGIKIQGKGVICDVNSLFTIQFEDRLARFAVYLQILLDSKNADMRELFLDSVCVCAPGEALGATNGETVVILDGTGAGQPKRTGGDIVDLSDEKQVIAKLSNLLHGGGKLRKRADAARTPAVRDAFSKLTSTDAREVAGAKAYLVEQIEHCSAAIVDARKNNPALRRALGEVITSTYQRSAAKDFQGVLPFGVKYEQHMIYDPCPPCGMARIPAGTRKMLKLLGK